MTPGIKDLFIGVIHLFVIFIPGAFILLTIGYVASYYEPPASIPIDRLGIDNSGATFLFLALSYFVGHLVSLVGSKIEDWLFKLFPRFDGGRKKITDMRPAVMRICQSRLGRRTVRPQDLRRWCAKLVKNDSDVFRVDLDAKDADRRFFRNILVVLVLMFFIVVTEVLRNNVGIYVPLLLGMLIFLSVFRYLDQDAKFTELVFESLIALNSEQESDSSAEALAGTHAGGVVFRKNRAKRRIEYLLVRAISKEEEESASPKGHAEWVLPKGHIKSFETPSDAAIREVLEETGEIAKLRYFVGFNSYKLKKEDVCVANYLMQGKSVPRSGEARDHGVGEKGRDPKWLDYEKAVKMLTYVDTKSILKLSAPLVESGAEIKRLIRRASKMAPPE